MMWEALAGCRRKIGETRNAMIEARITGQEPSIRAIRPEMPAGAGGDVRSGDRAGSREPPRVGGRAGLRLEHWLRKHSRQAGQRELAALVGGAFPDERQAMRARIEKELGGSDDRPDPRAGSPPAAAAPVASAAPVTSAAPISGAAPQAPASESPSHSQLYSMDLAGSGAEPAWAQRNRWLLAAGGLGAVAAVALVVALAGRQRALARRWAGGKDRPASRGSGPGSARADRPAPAPGVHRGLDTTLPAAVTPGQRQAGANDRTVARAEQGRAAHDRLASPGPDDAAPGHRSSASRFARTVGADPDVLATAPRRFHRPIWRRANGRRVTPPPMLDPSVPAEASRPAKICRDPRRGRPRRQLDEQDPYR